MMPVQPMRKQRYQLLVDSDQIREALGIALGTLSEKEILDKWNDRIRAAGTQAVRVKIDTPRPMAKALETK